MSPDTDFTRLLQAVSWPVYGLSPNPFYLARVGWGKTEREGKIVGVDIVYQGQEHIRMELHTLDAHERINMLGARRSLEAHSDPRLDQDSLLFRRYQVDKTLMGGLLKNPEILPQTFSVNGKIFDGQIRIWPALSLARFLFFEADVIILGDTRGLQQQELHDVLRMIVPLNEVKL